MKPNSQLITTFVTDVAFTHFERQAREFTLNCEIFSLTMRQYVKLTQLIEAKYTATTTALSSDSVKYLNAAQTLSYYVDDGIGYL